jgi:hypothetical protein
VGEQEEEEQGEEPEMHWGFLSRGGEGMGKEGSHSRRGEESGDKGSVR